MDDRHREVITRIAGSMGPVGNAASVPRLLAALWSDTLDGEGVARLVSAEPNLTMRILRVANSAYYGLSGTVSSVKRAVLILGHEAVRGIAAAGCLGRTIPASGNAAMGGGRLLRHSIATAVTAQALAEAVRLDRAGDAFIAGLLHDIGVAVQTHREGSDPQEQRALAELPHAAIGAVLIRAWNLPPWLEAVTQHHDAPLEAPPELRRLSAVVSLADALAGSRGFDHPFERHERNAETMAEVARVPAAVIERVMLEIPARANELYGALSRT